MLEWILGLYCLYLLMKLYAALMEIGFVEKAQRFEPVILSAVNYTKAAAYKIASQKLLLTTTLYDFILFFSWIGFGLRRLDEIVIFENTLLNSAAYVLVFSAINYLLTLPFEIYQTFGLDKKFGFSTITPRTFVLDQCKSAVMFVLFGGAFFAAMVSIIDTFKDWWIYGFVFSFAVVLFINMIYPIVIVPMFNKLTPLQDETLQGAIERLLEKAGLHSSGVFCLDASKRDNRLNAYFGGLGRSKRVVLFDTLIAKLTTSELLAVLGHELGHFAHKDILKNIAASALMLLVMFALFGNLPLALFESLHVEPSAHAIIALFLLFSPVISFAMMPLFGLMSRYNEYRADAYGSECENQEALRDALMKLADENKSFPFAHPLTIALYFTHPPLTKRLERLGMHFESSTKDACAH